MELGDLVQYKGKRWIVVKFEREVRLMTLMNFSLEKCEVPKDYDKTHKEELQVVANPSKQWRVLTAKVKSIKSGPFVKLVDPAEMGRPSRTLVPMVDWVPSDLGRCGGSFFVRPSLSLLPGALLIGTHRDGSSVRILVPKTFGTTAQRVALIENRKKEATKVVKRGLNRFNRILDDLD